MKRRQFLMSAMAVAASPTAKVLAATNARRRVRPGDVAWPAPADWKQLAGRLQGSLIRPELGWTSCDGPPSPQCSMMADHLTNPVALGDEPGATQISGYLDAWQSQPSAWVAEVHDSADMATIVRFAKRHNLRLVIKGGGHSYIGGSSAPDSLMIWTRKMNKVRLHEAFRPLGSSRPPQHAASIEAGAMWIDAYDAVTTRGGRYVQGGGCTTVGTAGFLQGGGFGSFSKMFGTGASNLLEAEVVTANGQVRVVNDARDPDLFWALKGGGGGTFAAVSRMTVATHELPEYMGGVDGVIRSKSPAAHERLIARFMRFYAAQLMNPHWGEQVKVRRDQLELGMACAGLTDQQMADAWAPFLGWVADHPGDYSWEEPFRHRTREARYAWDAVTRQKLGWRGFISDNRPGANPIHGWWQGDGEQAGEFWFGYESIWLPSALLSDDSREALARALVDASQHMEVGLHFNKGLAGASREVRDSARRTAMNPRVCDAFALAIIASGGRPPLKGLGFDGDQSTARSDARRIELAGRRLRSLVPSGGSYVSEASYFQSDWQKAFWGENYGRLLKIKNRYDPDGLFYVHHGVGSENWRENGFVPA